MKLHSLSSNTRIRSVNAVSVPLLSKLLRSVNRGLQLVGTWAYITPKMLLNTPKIQKYKGPTYENFEILRTKCIEVTTLKVLH